MTITRKLLLGVSLIGLACGDPAAPRGSRPAPLRAELLATPTLLECPSTTGVSGGGLVGVLGGTLAVGPVQVVIPAGALLSTQSISVTVPPSTYMEIDVSVAGTEHFVFEQPITVKVDYGRCSDPGSGTSLLDVWYIDAGTKQPLERMPTVDDKLTRTVTFTTGHLSGYALAN